MEGKEVGGGMWQGVLHSMAEKGRTKRWRVVGGEGVEHKTLGSIPSIKKRVARFAEGDLTLKKFNGGKSQKGWSSKEQSSGGGRTGYLGQVKPSISMKWEEHFFLMNGVVTLRMLSAISNRSPNSNEFKHEKENLLL